MVVEHGVGVRGVGVRGVLPRTVASTVGAVLLMGVLPGAVSASPASPVQAPSEPTSLSAMSLIPWFTAPSLVALRREVDTLWPGRSRLSDGSIGDNRHGRTVNSHNPVGASNGPRFGTRGAVHAMDITASGIDVNRLLMAVIGDPRVWYVIYDSKIWSRTYGWAARPYSGDPHTTHVHINLREDSQSAAVAAENGVGPWFSGKGGSAPAYLTAPTSGLSLTQSQVRALQTALIAAGFAIPAGATGHYGPQTTSAVAAFQRAQGWRGSGADGIAGPETLRRLGVSASVTVTPVSTSTPTPATTPTTTATTSTKNPAGLSKKKTKRLQRRLIKRGFTIPSGATGWYGPETTRAVKAFQRAQGWRGSGADGIAGNETLRRLGIKAKKSTTSTTSTSRAKNKSTATAATPTPTTTSSGRTGRRTWDPDDAYLVYDLQGALIARGFSIPAGQTGYFGTQTKAAVKAYQRSQGWRGAQADGIPGAQTLARLGL